MSKMGELVEVIARNQWMGGARSNNNHTAALNTCVKMTVDVGHRKVLFYEIL